MKDIFILLCPKKQGCHDKNDDRIYQGLLQIQG